jgi:hypothetical protein
MSKSPLLAVVSVDMSYQKHSTNWNYNLVRCDGVPFGAKFPTFRKMTLLSFQAYAVPETKAPRIFGTPAKTHPSTQCHLLSKEAERTSNIEFLLLGIHCRVFKNQI